MPITADIQTDLSIGEIQFQMESPMLFSYGPDIDITQAVDNYMTRNSTISQLRFPNDVPPMYFQMVFSEYDRKNLFEMNPKFNPLHNIILPLPTEIVDIHSVIYDEEAIGMPLGVGVNQFMNQNAKNGMDGAQGLNMEGIGKTVGAAYWNSAIAKAVDNTSQSFGLGSPVAAAKAAFGFSPNQFFTVLLRAPAYKDISFTWKLMPRSYEESFICREIIKTINNAMSPGLALGGAIFSFPLVVRCAFMPNYAHLMRFKPAVITDVQWNYTPGGGPAFFADPNGELPPESYAFEIRFRELEYWLASDFMGAEGDQFATTGDRRSNWKWEQPVRDYLGLDSNNSLNSRSRSPNPYANTGG